MYDLLSVDVIKAFTDLSDDRTDVWLFHSAVFTDHFEKLSISTELNEEVDVLLVLEVPVERTDIPVVEVELDAQLASDLVFVFL